MHKIGKSLVRHEDCGQFRYLNSSLNPDSFEIKEEKKNIIKNPNAQGIYINSKGNYSCKLDSGCRHV